jgi:5-methylcytosine-specific restriction endonuclease McrA
MNCEKCNTEHTGTYGSGRFCSKVCARGFSTSAKRDEINKKVSKTMTGVPYSSPRAYPPRPPETYQKMAEAHKHTIESLMERVFILNGMTFKRQYLARVRPIDKCEECGTTNWNGKPLVMQVDHINGNDRDNRLENLKVLCPNCHTQTETWGYKNKSESRLTLLQLTTK